MFTFVINFRIYSDKEHGRHGTTVNISFGLSCGSVDRLGPPPPVGRRTEAYIYMLAMVDEFGWQKRRTGLFTCQEHLNNYIFWCKSDCTALLQMLNDTTKIRGERERMWAGRIWWRAEWSLFTWTMDLDQELWYSPSRKIIGRHLEAWNDSYEVCAGKYLNWWIGHFVHFDHFIPSSIVHFSWPYFRRLLFLFLLWLSILWADNLLHHAPLEIVGIIRWIYLLMKNRINGINSQM